MFASRHGVLLSLTFPVLVDLFPGGVCSRIPLGTIPPGADHASSSARHLPAWREGGDADFTFAHTRGSICRPTAPVFGGEAMAAGVRVLMVYPCVGLFSSWSGLSLGLAAPRLDMFCSIVISVFSTRAKRSFTAAEEMSTASLTRAAPSALLCNPCVVRRLAVGLRCAVRRLQT